MTTSLDDFVTVDLSQIEKLDISDLDGWKTFVRLRDAYTPPPLLTRDDYESLNLRDRVKYDAIRHIGNFNMPKLQTPMTAHVRNQVERVLRANIYRMDPGVRSGVFISADGSMGKSTLMREIAANHEAELEALRTVLPGSIHFRDRWVPVAWVTVPPKLSIRSLATAILNFYGEPFRASATDPQMTRRVEDVIRDCGTRLLVLDDITRYKDAEADRYASDWIRNLMESSVTIIALGVDVRGSGILYDGARGREQRLRTQTAQRFTVLDIEPFRYDTDDTTRDWVEHLRAVEADLLLLDKEPGMLEAHAEYIYARTGGVIGVFSEWVQLAAVSVIGRHPADGGETLTRADLDDAPIRGQHTPPDTPLVQPRSKTKKTKRVPAKKGRNTVFDQPTRHPNSRTAKTPSTPQDGVA